MCFYLRIAGHRLTRVVVVVGTKLKILVETCFGVLSGSLLIESIADAHYEKSIILFAFSLFLLCSFFAHLFSKFCVYERML